MTEPAREPMPPEEYVAYGGIRCPFCRGVDLDSQGVELYEGGCKCDVRCLSCGARWTEFYTLTSYEVTYDA